MKIAIVDYGAGNLPSVERALRGLGAETERAVEPGQLRAAKAIVLPGVGHMVQDAAPDLVIREIEGLVALPRRGNAAAAN